MRRTDSKIPESDYVFGYRRSENTMLRMAEEEYRSESWTMELDEELYNTGLAFLWTKLKECDFREIYKDSERQM